MHAIKLTAMVTPDRRLVVQLPPDAPTAGKAEVIVLVDSETPTKDSRPLSLVELIASLRMSTPGRSIEDIDSALMAERDAWDD